MNWVNSFVCNEILVCNSINKELQTKSCCEFLLFCYNLKLIGKLDYERINLLKLFESIVDIQFYKPLYQICTNDLENIETDKMECIENKFIESVVTGYDNYDYWLSLLNKHLMAIVKTGLNKQSIYNLTHIVFYSTNFGNNDFINRINIDIKKIIEDILKICITFCEKNYNWDLLREVYLSMYYFDTVYNNEFKTRIKSENKHIKSNMGWYLSDGLNLEYFENNYHELSFIQKYSLYHTTLICELLEKTISKKNYA